MQVNIVKLDETRFWVDVKFREKVGRLFGVYLYDPKAGYHACEYTTSRELHRIGVVVERMPEDEGEQEKILDYIREACIGEEDSILMHASSVDQLPKLENNSALETGRCLFGEFGDGDPWLRLDKFDSASDCGFAKAKSEVWAESYSAIEEAREYAVGNGFTDA